ncbi:hypothetical protein [Aggregatimonas sangjinii]|nr:hypothetical protein [Aggregatimonas sangjinii]
MRYSFAIKGRYILTNSLTLNFNAAGQWVQRTITLRANTTELVLPSND